MTGESGSAAKPLINRRLTFGGGFELGKVAAASDNPDVSSVEEALEMIHSMVQALTYPETFKDGFREGWIWGRRLVEMDRRPCGCPADDVLHDAQICKDWDEFRP